MSSIIFFFFFKAEDGIRDDLVTGVQTCALPIWLSDQYQRILELAAVGAGIGPKAAADRAGNAGQEFQIGDAGISGGQRDIRSGERRVGKEGRSRWSPYH